MTWRDDYKRAVLRYFLDHAQVSPVADPKRGTAATGYFSDGWFGDGQASDAAEVRRHFSACEIDVSASSMLEDANWQTWGGTMESDRQHWGYEIVLTCKCGQIAGRKFRMEGSGLAALVNKLAGG